MATLLLDFDGTICLGDDPVLAYADSVAARLGDDDAGALQSALSAFLSGATSDGFVDGYAAVAAYSTGRLSPEELADAYLESRQVLADGALDVWAPPGLAGFLGEISGAARVVVATNAPSLGVGETLAELGIADVVQSVITDAGKPDGMNGMLDSLLGEQPARTLLSIGDIWRNDLEIPHRRGCVTALIDRFRTGDSRPTLLAERFEDLYPLVLEWSRAPESFAYRTLDDTPQGIS